MSQFKLTDLKTKKAVIVDERLSPMTYKKLKELGYNSDRWKNLTQEEANRIVQKGKNSGNSKSSKKEEEKKVNKNPKQEENKKEMKLSSDDAQYTNEKLKKIDENDLELQSVCKNLKDLYYYDYETDRDLKYKYISKKEYNFLKEMIKTKSEKLEKEYDKAQNLFKSIMKSEPNISEKELKGEDYSKIWKEAYDTFSTDKTNTEKIINNIKSSKDAKRVYSIIRDIESELGIRGIYRTSYFNKIYDDLMIKVLSKKDN